jgi:CBS domain-containing protein
MADENIFFLKAREFCNRPVYSCSPSDTVDVAARKMSEANVSSLFVCEDDMPLGIVTDRDFRNKVVAADLNPRQTQVQAVMSAPLVSVRADDYLFEAFHRMSKHGIHRVAIVDEKGKLCGVLTDSDLLKLQTNAPQYLIRDLENASDVGELKRLYARAREQVIRLSRSGGKTMDLVRLISHVHDSLTLRLIAYLRENEFPDLPAGFAFVVLGSEGRMEQTLKTDQDNAIVHADDLDEKELATLVAFSTRLIDSLIEVGVPPCPGGIMAKNEFWRQSLTVWKARIRDWTTTPTPDNILSYSMFSDIRLLYGDAELVGELSDFTRRRVRENALFAAYMAQNVQRFEPPIGWFGHFKVEESGDHRGQLDIKKAGLFTITEGIKLLAMSAAVAGTGTWERIELLGESGDLSPDEVVELKTSYAFLVQIRLKSQVASIEAGEAASDYVDPRKLNIVERNRLRVALEAVGSFQHFIKLRYKADILS